MSAKSQPGVDAAFGNWLAGFIDGEGCFVVSQNSGRPGYRCSLVVKLRLDDEPILREIQQRTGIGRLSRHKEREPDRHREATATWRVDSRRDCARMVELLDTFPLRAKKARDYEIWRSAVRLWGAVRRGPSLSWAVFQMAECRRQLTAVRGFEGDEIEATEIPEQFELGVGA